METQQFQLSEANVGKLTDWTHEPTLIQLKSDLEAAKPAQQTQINKINRWNDLLNTTGMSRPKKIKGRSSVQPKLIRRQAEWRYSALTEPFLNSDKMFKVEPVSFEDARGAEQNGKVLNYQFRTQINRVKFIDQYVRGVVDEGTAILRTGWKRHTVTMKEDVPVYSFYPIENPEDLEKFKSAMQAKLEDHHTFENTTPEEMKQAVTYFEDTHTATTAKKTGSEKQDVEKVLINRPTVEVMNPANVFIDPSCNGEIEKAMFIIVTFETTKADLVKEGKRYKNLDKVNWSDASPLATPDHVTTTPQEFNLAGARKKVVAVEYWGFFDTKGDDSLTPFVATWVGSTLIRMEENPFPDKKLPFVLVPYLPVKRDVYGQPDAELLEDNQNILGAVTRGMIDLLGRSANGQQGFAKGMLDPLNRRRYENGQDYEFNPNLSPANGLIEHKYPEFPNSAMNLLGMQNQEAEALTGVKSFGGGLSGESYGDVAAGVRGAMDAASKREMAILRRLAKGLAEVGEKFASMNQAFLSEEETIRITNEVFEKIIRDELAGEFDFSVDISTAEVDDAKSKDLAFMLQTMGPNLDIGMTIMILAEIAELKRMPELAHKIRSYAPKPDPIAQEKAQLEVEELKLKIELLKSEARVNDARALQLKADADQKSLGFVEQETGTKHARDLELQKEQAQGNKELAVTKALLAKRKPDESAPDVEAAIGYNTLTKDRGNVGGNSAPAPVDNQPVPAELPPVDPTMMGQQIPDGSQVDPGAPVDPAMQEPQDPGMTQGL